MPESFVNAYLEDDQTVVALRREPGGKLVAKRFPAQWESFCLSEDLSPAQESSLRKSRAVRLLRREGRWVRIGWQNRRVRKQMCTDEKSPLVQAGIHSYEADVHPVARWLADSGALVQRPLACYLDIETDSRVSFRERENMRVLCWSVRDEEDRLVDRHCIEEDSNDAERESLARLWRVLLRFDQVVCWNGSYNDELAFDFDVVFKRSRARGLQVDTRRWLWLDLLPLFEKMNAHAAASGEEKRSMKLGDIGQEIVGEAKEQAPPWVIERFGEKECSRGLGPLSWQLWAAGGEFRQLLLDYCDKDTSLLARIAKKTGFVALNQALCEACSIFGDMASLNATRRVEGFMLRYAAEQGHHFATKRYGQQEANQFKGALVLHPRTVASDKKEVRWSEEDARAWRERRGMKNGILPEAHVIDFSGMYPAIILTWNMSPESLAEGHPPNGPLAEGHCRSPLTDVTFRNEPQGFLAAAVAFLIEKRKFYSDLKVKLLKEGDEEGALAASRLSDAYKIAINSFYGVAGSPYSRYYDRRVGESVAQCGVWLIKRVLEEVEKRGGEAVTLDTDGIYVVGLTAEQMTEFTKWCNETLFPEMTGSVGCKKCHMKMAYEKRIQRAIFGAKKRYIATVSWYKGANVRQTEVKGFEFKRGDVARLAYQLQAEVIDMLQGKEGVEPTEDIERYHLALSRMRDHVLKDALGVDDVKVSKGLQQGVEEYKTREKKDGTQSLPPSHVQVAKTMLERGEEVGTGARVEYVVVDSASSPAKVIPASDYDGNFDRHYLWEDCVFPPTQRLLEAAFPDVDWTGWAKTRPRGRSKPLEGQLGLPSVESLVPVEQRIAAGNVDPGPQAAGKPGRRKAKTSLPLPYVVVLDERTVPLDRVGPLKDILLRYPGRNPVVLRYEREGGGAEDYPTSVSVHGDSDPLDVEVTAWLDAQDGGAA